MSTKEPGMPSGSDRNLFKSGKPELSLEHISDIAELSGIYLKSDTAEFSEEDLVCNLHSLWQMSKQPDTKISKKHAKQIQKMVLSAQKFGTDNANKTPEKKAGKIRASVTHFKQKIMDWTHRLAKTEEKEEGLAADKRVLMEEKLKNLPELKKGIDMWQNKMHEFDVYAHTLKFVEFMKKNSSDLEMIAAAYLHDLGKPAVAKVKLKDGVPQKSKDGKQYHEFDGHEEVGAEMVRAMKPDLFLEFGLNQERVAKLVGAHYLPLKGIKKMRATINYSGFEVEYENLLKTLDKTGLKREEVMLMFLSDSYAKGKGCTDLNELMKIREAILAPNKSEKENQLLKEAYVIQMDFAKKEEKGYEKKEPLQTTK